MPGYRKTAEEVKNIENFLAPSRFICEELAVKFETSWEYARSVLPPALTPVEGSESGTAQAFVSIAQFQSAYCGPMDCAIIGLWTEFEGSIGFYMLTELISNELPVTIGRELWGEIKKTGNTRVYRDGNSCFGTAERLGHTVFEIHATIDGPEQGASEAKYHAFDIKMFPNSDGRGLEYPPRLNVWNCASQYSSVRSGTGKIKWGQSPWDPAWTIPILKTGEATLSNYVACFPLGRQVELSDPDNIYPQFMWGRGYDDPTLYAIPERWAGVDEVNQPAKPPVAR